MKKRIAVIGAGLSGLTAIKQLKDEGHEVTCYERAADFGGVFKSQGACYEGLKLTVSNYFMAYSDFVPTKQRYKFWNQKEYRDYLGEYVDRFELVQHLRLEHQVLCVQREHGSWAVTTESLGKTTVEWFDAVAVCSGMFVHKKVPKFEGLEAFLGHVSHTQDFKNSQQFAGKKVLCVGLGESSSDVTSEISEVASKCYLSLRRYPAVAPRYVPFQKDQYFTIDSSWNTVRNFNNIPKYFHKQLTGKIFKQYKTSRNPQTRLRGQWLRQAGPSGDQVINKNERVFTQIVDGKVEPNMSGIERFNATSVTFRDGVEVAVDAVVFCTGFEIQFPFLKQSVKPNLRSLYLQIFDPEKDESLAFIGFARPQQGGLAAISEMQARLFARICSGKAKLPGAAEQRACAMQHERHWRQEYRITPNAVGLVNYVHYMDLLAAKVGCLPVRPAFLADWAMRIKLDFNPIFAAQYRLNGPHAAKEESRSFLLSFPNIFSRYWIAYLMLVRCWLTLRRDNRRTKLLDSTERVPVVPPVTPAVGESFA